MVFFQGHFLVACVIIQFVTVLTSDKCCDMSYKDNNEEGATKMFQCFNTTLAATSKPLGVPKTRIGIVTYTTRSIMDYASYSLSMTTLWANRHGYVPKNSLIALHVEARALSNLAHFLSHYQNLYNGYIMYGI